MVCLQVIGLDIAKNVFQLHTVDMSTGEIFNVQLKRGNFLGHFANHVPCLIGIEACCGSSSERRTSCCSALLAWAKPAWPSGDLSTQAGLKTRFISATDLVVALVAAQRQERLAEFIRRNVMTPRFLVIDEIGFTPYSYFLNASVIPLSCRCKDALAYTFIVVLMLECPSWACTTSIGTSRSMARVAKV